MSSTNGGNLSQKQVPSQRSKNVVQVVANPAKLRTEGDKSEKNGLPRFVTSRHSLAGCVGSGKI